jgi:hypothetical protein
MTCPNFTARPAAANDGHTPQVDAGAAARSRSPIVLENQQPGSEDATGQIKGYTSATSVKLNENITLFVTVNPAQSYTIDLHRVGWSSS